MADDDDPRYVKIDEHRHQVFSQVADGRLSRRRVRHSIARRVEGYGAIAEFRKRILDLGVLDQGHPPLVNQEQRHLGAFRPYVPVMDLAHGGRRVTFSVGHDSGATPIVVSLRRDVGEKNRTGND